MMTQIQGSENQLDALRIDLTNKLTNNIESFRNKRDFNRKRAFRLKMAITSIGVLTTIVLGLKPYIIFQNSETILSAVALVLSAIIPFFAAWEGFFDHRWLWIRYTETLNSLYAIRDEVDYVKAGGKITKEQLDSLFARLQRTLEETNTEWSKQRKDAIGRQKRSQAAALEQKSAD